MIPAYAEAGLRRRSLIKARVFWNGDLGQLESDVATMAPIFTSFSRSVVSDQCSTSSGTAKVRMKLARLFGQGIKLEPNLVVAELTA